MRRLWAACGLPDFRKTGPEHHARLVARLFAHLSEGDGRIPQGWYAEQVARLDNVQGDIDTLADRIAGVRTWAYIAHRADWLADPAAMAERTMAVEEKLSDALHERLTQRFVDRRTAVLMRDLGKKGAGEFPVAGRRRGRGQRRLLSRSGGCRASPSRSIPPPATPTARCCSPPPSAASAGEYEKRAAALVADTDDHFALRTEAGQPVAILWRGHEVARLGPGKNLLSPAHPARPAHRPRLGQGPRGGDPAPQGLAARRRRSGARAAPRRRPRRPGSGGAAPRCARCSPCWSTKAGSSRARPSPAPLAALDREQRRAVTRLGVRIGALDLFMPAVLKPEAMRWRAALRAAAAGAPMPALPPDASVVLPTPADRALLTRLGFRAAGPQMIRVDIAERIAARAHEARAAGERRGDRRRLWSPRSASSRRRWPS